MYKYILFEIGGEKLELYRSKMPIKKSLLNNSIKLFTKLLSAAESENDDFFGLKIEDKTASGDISRASAQLIEICSWLDILPVVEDRLKGLVEFLQSQTASNSANIYAHPSRIRAVLLFGKYEHQSLENSIAHLLEDSPEYMNSSFLTKLAYTDLMGTLIYYNKNNRLPINFPKKINVIKKAKKIHKKFLNNIWSSITIPYGKKEIIARDLSYAMWLLLLNNYYDSKKSRKATFKRHLDYLEQKTKVITDDDSLKKYKVGKFARIIYPHLFLFFIQRKKHRNFDVHPNYFNWLIHCTKKLLDDFNGYHAGLLIKQILAIDKEEFKNSYFKKSVYSLIKRENKVLESNYNELSLITNILKQSTAVDIKKIVKLTAGWSRARVYKVKAKINTPLREEDIFDPVSYVIKLAPPKEINRSTSVYNALPSEASDLFATLNIKTESGIIDKDGTSYAVMKYLDDFKEYSTIVKDLLPHDKTQAPQIKKLCKSTRISLSLLKELHSLPSTAIKALKESETFEVRISSLIKYFDILSRKKSFLKVVINEGTNLKFYDTSKRIKPGLHSVVELLNLFNNIPNVKRSKDDHKNSVIIHGDCHGNNIMINSDFSKSRFIDIGDIHVNDYLIDYAQIAAHICFSMNLEQYSNEDLAWFIKPFGKTGQFGNIDNLYPERWKGLGNIWDIINNEIKNTILECESILALRRFAYYLAERLFFIAAKSTSPNKSLILYLQGSIILNQLINSLKKDQKGIDLQNHLIPPGKNIEIII